MLTVGTPVLSAIQGKVLDKTGRPIPGTRVICLSSAFEGGRTADLYTDKSGKFTCPPANRPVKVVAVARGYTFGTTDYDPRRASKMAVITLWPERKRRGRVVDEKGRPVAGATIRVRSISAVSSDSGDWVHMSPPESWAESYETTTGRDGSFVLTHLPRNDDFSSVWVSLAVSKPGRALIEKNLVLTETSGRSVIVQPPACRLEGVLYLPGKAGTAPEGLVVQLLRWEESGWWSARMIHTDKDGRFVADELRPGRIVVGLTRRQSGAGAEDGRSRWILPLQEIELSPDRDEVLEFVMEKGALITGSVVDQSSGKPIPDAIFRVRDASRLESYFGEGALFTDRGGRFAVRVAPGEVSISVRGFQEGADYIPFEDSEWPSVNLIAVDGEDRSDVIINVDPSGASEKIYRNLRAPIPADFVLGPGEYELSWDSELYTGQSSTYQPRYADQEAASRLKSLPNLVSEEPKYEMFPLDGLGDESLLAVVLDESQGTGKGYDTAFIDTDRDWDLSDEAPLSWRIVGEGSVRYTPWTSVQARQGEADGKHANNPLKIRLETWKDKDSYRVSLQRRGAWKGMIDSNKGKIECATIDSNANGIYGEQIAVAHDLEFDRNSYDDFCADVNGLGCVVVPYNSPHRMTLNRIVALAGNLYSIDINQTGNRVRITRYDGPTGEVQLRIHSVGGLPATVNSIGLIGKTGFYEPWDYPERPAILPAGRYKLAYCGLELTTKHGDKLHLICHSTIIRNIREGRQTTIHAGGNVSVAIEPERQNLVLTAGSSQPLNWRMRIGGSLVVRGIRSGNRGYVPIVKFFDAKGRMLRKRHAGAIQGGREYAYVVRVPRLRVGTYTLQMAMDTRSELGWLVAKRPVRITASE
jgi:hypothetical protein